MKLPQNIFEKLIAVAQKTAPEEGCGILAGRDDEVTEFYEMENVAHSSDWFELKPEDQFKVIKDIRAKELKMLGIFHSHPASPARPSEEDIRHAFYPDSLYFILSLENSDEPVLKAFTIVDGEVAEKTFEII